MQSQNHEFKLSTGELNALKLLARNLSCPDLSYCEDFACYKGHVCVHDVRGRCDKAKDCYFSEAHGVDTVGRITSPLELMLILTSGLRSRCLKMAGGRCCRCVCRQPALRGVRKYHLSA